MKHTSVATIVLCLVLVMAVAVFATAQRPTSQPQQKSQPRGIPPMSMDEMMQGCSKHSETSTTILESVIRQAEAAKKSGELPKMQLALDNAQQQLQEVKKHVESCRSMMNMMRDMQRSVGSQKSQKAPPKVPPK